MSDKVGLLGGLSTSKLLIGVLGFGSPLGLAVVAGFALFRSRARHRRAEKPREPQTPPEEMRSVRPIAIDSPPVVQDAIPETHYVPYERSGFSQAYQWASEQVARKYPGAVDTLTALDSLIKQQVNAQD